MTDPLEVSRERCRLAAEALGLAQEELEAAELLHRAAVERRLAAAREYEAARVERLALVTSPPAPDPPEAALPYDGLDT